MQVSKLAKNMLKYRPVLAVLLVTGIGVWVAKDLYPIEKVLLFRWFSRQPAVASHCPATS
jgi:hypothetical protein